MTPAVVGLLSPGDMGQAVAELLMRGGVNVVTCLEGRSERTRTLARAAGIGDVPTLGDLVREAPLVISIVPPAQAVAVARDVAAALGTTGSTIVYVDCNAVSPRTVREVAAEIVACGSGFVDAGIIGGPPRGTPSPRFFACGPDRSRFVELAAAGLDVVPLGPEIGEASAVKMCYAALTKGTTAIATELLVAARKLGVYEAVIGELRSSETTAGRLRGVESMPGKAHRWVAEMEEIARTFAEVGLTPLMFEGAAEMYRLTAASAMGGERPETVDRARGLDGTVDVLARASEGVASTR